MGEDITSQITLTYPSDICRATRVGNMAIITIIAGSENNVPNLGSIGVINQPYRPPISHFAIAMGFNEAIGMVTVERDGNIKVHGSVFGGWYGFTVVYAFMK